MHRGEKSNKCNQCDYASTRAGHLKRHLKAHSGEKSNKCSQCDYASTQASNLRTHLNTHSSGEKSYKCNQCDFASVQSGDLRTHMNIHSGEKSNKCNQCDFACSDPSSLSQHLKMHSGEKSNKCIYYNLASSWTGHLRRNLKTHSGEKTNKCNQCDISTMHPLREAIWGDIWKNIWRISFQNSLSPLEAWKKNIHFSFSSQKSRICFQISLSLLKVGEQHFKFLCLFSKMVNLFSLSLSPFEVWEKNIPFSFSSRKLRIFFQISLSLLKTGERIFKFLLLLSKLEKIISNFSFSSRLDFLASHHTLVATHFSEVITNTSHPRCIKCAPQTLVCSNFGQPQYDAKDHDDIEEGDGWDMQTRAGLQSYPSLKRPSFTSDVDTLQKLFQLHIWWGGPSGKFNDDNDDDISSYDDHDDDISSYECFMPGVYGNDIQRRLHSKYRNRLGNRWS